MASVTVRTGPVSASDKARDVDPKRWIELTWARRSFVAVKVQYDCRSLIGFVDEAEQFRIWEKTGHADLGDYIRNGLEIAPELVEWARIGLESLDRSKPQPLRLAAERGQQTLAERAALARAQADPESPEYVKPKGRKAKSLNVSNTDNSERNSTPGTLRRLARTRPELLARVEAGELSVNAAALEAGIRKRHKSIPVDSAESAIRALRRVFTDEELVEALECLRARTEEEGAPCS